MKICSNEMAAIVCGTGGPSGGGMSFLGSLTGTDSGVTNGVRDDGRALGVSLGGQEAYDIAQAEAPEKATYETTGWGRRDAGDTDYSGDRDTGIDAVEDDPGYGRWEVDC